MKIHKILFVAGFLFSAAHTVARSVLYQNDAGQSLVITSTQTGVIMNFGGQSVHLPVNVMNTDLNYFMYNNNGGVNR